MRNFAFLMIAGSLLISPVYAQNTAVEGNTATEAPAEDAVKPVVTRKERPPVVPNERKAAFEAKKKAEAEQAIKDAEAAKQRLEDAKKAKAAAAAEPKIEYRRYDPTVRDAMTGKEVVQKQKVEKKKTRNEEIRDKYKKKRDER